MNDEEIIESFDTEKDKSLKIQLKKVDTLEHCIIIVLAGYIDTYNSTFFLKRVMTLINGGYTQLIFDCTALDYVSSTGIGSFTTFLKAVKAKSGDISLANLQPKVYEVFQLLGFANFFNVRNSVDAAIQLFQKIDTEDTVDEIFPKLFSCPICAKKLRALAAGTFKCVECKTNLLIDANAQVSLK